MYISYAEHLVSLPTIDKVWSISREICVKSGFWVPGLQYNFRSRDWIPKMNCRSRDWIPKMNCRSRYGMDTTTLYISVYLVHVTVQFSRDRDRRAKVRSQFSRIRSRSWSREGPVPLCSEPKPVFGPGTGSATELKMECISISALNTIQFIKKSEPAPRRPEPEL